MTRQIGCSLRMPGIGSVMKSWWRIGTTGMRIPDSSATCRVQAPAASTTIGAEIDPLLVVTPVTRPLPLSRSRPVTGVSVSTVTPCARAAAV